LLEDLAAAYAHGAAYLVATAREVIKGSETEEAADAARAADAAGHRLDDSFRQYLAERTATPVSVDDVAVLVVGTSRLRRAARSLSSLGRMVDGDPRVEQCGRNLEGELNALQSWYVNLGYALVNRRPVPPPHIRDSGGAARLMACIREAAGQGDKATVNAALVLLWTSQHLENVWSHEASLGERANTAWVAPVTGGTLRKLMNAVG
jgi:hypothetical protein